MQSRDVINFWFKEIKPDKWFEKDDALDLRITELFIVLHSQAMAGELYSWRKTPIGSLAEIIVIDQFSRNIYRDDPKAYAGDPLALALSQTAIANNFDKDLPAQEKQFLYMPFMHSESKLIHQEAIKLFSEEGLGNALDYERQHKKVIDQFGRFPHRNHILERPSTAEEVTYLTHNTHFFGTTVSPEKSPPSSL